MAIASTVPVSGTLLHAKDTDTTERIILPITGYDCLIDAPYIGANKTIHPRAPFLFLITGEETIEDAELEKILKF